MKKTSTKNKTPKQNSTPAASRASSARGVSAGDFNDWRKGNDGVWHLDVPLSLGGQEYRFVADGVWQDESASRIPVERQAQQSPLAAANPQ